ncbi:MAG: MarC family protein [Candidatus Korarchaeum sp.]
MELAEVGVSATQIFAILNPISVPIFLSLTEGRGEAELRRVIKVTSVTIFAMMVLFSVAGDLILGTLGITVRGLKLGGGAILLVLAMDMLQGMPRTKSVEEEELAVVPLATPLLMGPGTMTTILLLSSKYSREYGYLASSLMLVAASRHRANLPHTRQLEEVEGAAGNERDRGGREVHGDNSSSYGGGHDQLGTARPTGVIREAGG